MPLSVLRWDQTTMSFPTMVKGPAEFPVAAQEEFVLRFRSHPGAADAAEHPEPVTGARAAPLASASMLNTEVSEAVASIRREGSCRH